MTIGKVEIFLIVVLIAGAAWMGSQFLPVGSGFGSCNPIPLSAEVKAYVDSKIAGGGANQCGDMPKVASRVSALEGRMSDLDAYKKMREEVEEKRQELEQALAQQREEQNHVLAKVRAAEVESLKTEVGRLCAGITVRSASPSGGGNERQMRTDESMQERQQRRLKEREERMEQKRADREKARGARAGGAPAAAGGGAAAPAPAATPAPDANAQPK